MPGWLKNSLLIYVGYLGFCLIFILPLLNLAPGWFVERQYQRPFKSQFIYFNPFSNSVVAHKVHLDNPDGSAFLEFNRAEVNLSLASLWQTGWVLDRIQLAGMNLSLSRDQQGRFNFDDLRPTQDTEPKPAAKPSIPGVTIHQLDLSAQRIAWSDLSHTEAFATHVDDLSISVTGLSTVRTESKTYSLAARSENGGELYWEGLVSIPQGSSTGKLRINNFSLVPVWRYIAPWVNFELPSATLSTNGSYDVNWSDQLTYHVSDTAVAVSNVEVLPAARLDMADTRLELAQLQVTGIDLRSDGNLSANSITLQKPIIEGWSESNEISLQTLFATNRLPGAGEPAKADSARPAINWQATVESLQLIDGALHWRSEYTEPALTHVTPINAELGAIHWPFTGSTPAKLIFTLNDQATASIDGALELASGNGQFNLALGNIQLPWFEPAIPDDFQASLNSGQFSGQGTLSIGAFKPQHLTLNSSLTDLAISLLDDEETLTRWDALHFEGLNIAFDQQQLALNNVRLNGYNGRLHIYQDGTINTSAVLRKQLEKREASSNETAPPAQPWQFDITSVQVTDSQLDFMDETLPIVFRTKIAGLKGEITGLSSDPAKTAQIKLAGTVDDYAPVKLQGSANPTAQQTALKLKLTFDGLDLVRLTTYSATYAGYPIEHGAMDVNVKYTLDNKRLRGDNKLIIDQLKLGDRINSDKAVNLPLKLAIALLTDAKGVINLSVPVAGNVDDPDFSLGSVIVNAFINLVVKAAASPFKLLAGLVSSEEDLQRINFPAGSSELDELAQQKLRILAEAFNKRPRLKLLIAGRINPELDRQHLQEQALTAELFTAGVSEQAINTKSEEWAKSIKKRYAALDLPATDETGQPASLLEQHEAVINTMVISDNQLQALAESRAVATKSFLVNQAGLAPDRMAIDKIDFNKESNTFSGVELGVD